MSIKADLKALYSAGRQYFPDQAKLVGKECTRLRGVIDELDIAAAHEGDSKVLTHALSVVDDVHDALRQVVITLSDCGVGLVAIADDYVRTDQAARDAFRALQGQLPDQEPTPPIPERNGNPERPGADETESSPEPETPDEEKRRRDEELSASTGSEL